MYNTFVVCGATTKVAAFLSREVVTMKVLAELAYGGGKNVNKSTVINPVVTQRVCNLAWYCMDRDRRGIASLNNDEVTLNLLDDCAEHMRVEGSRIMHLPRKSQGRLN